MLACEPCPGVRVVAEPNVLDQLIAALDKPQNVWRFAPDDVFLSDLVGDDSSASDPHSIVAQDRGWTLLPVSDVEFAQSVAPYVDWSVPTEPLAVGQGNVAAVPAKVRRNGGNSGFEILVQTAYLADLLDRLR